MTTAEMIWQTSSYSANGVNCVEVGRVWRTSSYSGNGVNCVEVGRAVRSGSAPVAVRDSKNRTGPALEFTPSCWTGLLGALRTN